MLPPQKPKTGRPNKDHRTVLSGIIRILRTGAPWRALPERFGSPKTGSSRFSRWRRAGTRQRILERLQQLRDQEGDLDWGEHFVDGTVVRAHQQAAEAKGGPRNRSVGAESRWVQYTSPCASRARR